MNKLSIVHRIFASCAILVALIVLVAVVAAVNTQQIQSGLHQITNDANQLNTMSADFKQLMIQLDSPLSALQNANSPETLDQARAEFSRIIQRAEQLAKKLVEQAEFYNHPHVSTIIADVIQRLEATIAHESEMARLQAAILQGSGEISNARQEFLLSNSFTAAAINKAVDPAAEFDSYIKSMQSEFHKSREMVQFLVINILSESDPKEMKQLQERAQHFLVNVKDFYQSLLTEVPALADDQEVIDGMKGLFFALEDSGGVIARYIRNVNGELEIQRELELAVGVIADSLKEMEKGTAYVEDVIRETKTDADDAVARMYTAIAIALVIALLISLAVAWALARMIRVPMAKVIDVLGAMSNGNFSLHIDHKGQDEFSLIASSVSSLSDNMKEVIRDLREKSDQLNEVAQRNSQATVRAHSALERQNTEVQGVAAAITQMESAVTEIARNTDSSLEQTLEVEQQATQGRTIMSDSISTISHLAEQIDASNAVIGEVDQLTSKINTIVDVINNIADQTNLLALNAAIEAARAGEHGRGFAVVADEVRQLASQTASSTEEIQNMISQLQKQSEAAVSSMASNVEEMHSTREHIEQASESMNTIQERISLVRDMANLVSEAAGQQQVAAEEITRNVNVVSDVSNENFTEIEGIAKTTGELNDMASEQNQLLSRFSV